MSRKPKQLDARAKKSGKLALTYNDICKTLICRLVRALQIPVARLSVDLHTIVQDEQQHTPKLKAITELAQWLHPLNVQAVDAVFRDGELYIAFRVEDEHASSTATTVNGSVLPDSLTETIAKAFDAKVYVSAGATVSFASPTFNDLCGAAISTLGLRYYARLRSYEAESVLDLDPEGVHQLRVSVRRLRVILSVARRIWPDHQGIEGVIQWVRSVGEAGGGVRDFDVVRALLVDVVPPSKDLDSVLARLDLRRTRAVASLRALLLSDKFEQQATELETLFKQLAQATSTTTIDGYAKNHVARELRKLRLSIIGDLTHPDGYHAIRRRMRRVRDFSELFRSAIRKRIRALRKELSPIQSLLGSLNDIDVALDLVGAKWSGSKTVRNALTHQRMDVLCQLAVPLSVMAIRLLSTNHSVRV